MSTNKAPRVKKPLNGSRRAKLVKRQVSDSTMEPNSVTFKIESLFRAAVHRFRTQMTVKIDYADELVTRTRESTVGLVTFFLVDDLLETLNMNATRATFEAESGFRLNKVHDRNAIATMFQMAENVKLLDTVLEVLVTWYMPRADTLRVSSADSWSVWQEMRVVDFIRQYKQMFEGFPGDETKRFYEETSLSEQLHVCDPNRTGVVLILDDLEEPAKRCTKLKCQKRSRNRRRRMNKLRRSRKNQSIGSRGELKGTTETEECKREEEFCCHSRKKGGESCKLQSNQKKQKPQRQVKEKGEEFVD